MAQPINKPAGTCVACGEAIVAERKTSADGRLIGYTRNHHCDPKKISRREAAMMNFDRLPRRLSRAELMAEGFSILVLGGFGQ